jgi:SAM-dependent methyltransferase
LPRRHGRRGQDHQPFISLALELPGRPRRVYAARHLDQVNAIASPSIGTGEWFYRGEHEALAMEHTLTPAAGEQINRRFAGTQHVVSWNGEDLECRVLRQARKAIDPPELRAAVRALIDANCVREPSAIEESADDVTFHWRRVGKLTYVWEWPAEGWRAAAIVALRTLDVLRRQNLTLRALQHGDLFMVGSKPTIANLGGVMRWSAEVEANSLEQIERLYVRPLECAVHGQARLARGFMRGDIKGLSSEDAAAIVGVNADRRGPLTPAETLAWLEQAAMPVQSMKGASWQSYEARMTVGRSEEIAAKSAAVLSTLARLRPASVLDIGCNTGLFSQLAANEGAMVVGLDGDDDCLNVFFTRASSWSNPATAVNMNLADPSPVRGWGDGWCSAAERRLSSDLVLALALIHHLALGARMRPEEIRHCFASLAQRWLLLEFVPLGPTNPYTWGSDFYTRDWLLSVLGADFTMRKSWSHGERDRVLLLLERQQDARQPSR